MEEDQIPYIAPTPVEPVVPISLPNSPQNPTQAKTQPKVPIDKLIDNFASTLKLSGETNPYKPAEVFRSPALEPYIAQGLSFNPQTIESGSLEKTAYQSQSYLDRLGNNLKISGANAVSTFMGTMLEIPQIAKDTFSDDESLQMIQPIATWRDDVQQANTSFRSPVDDEQGVGGYLLPSWITGSTESVWGTALESAGFGLGAIGGTLLSEAILTFATSGSATLPYLGKKIFDGVRYLSKLGKVERLSEGIKATQAALGLAGTQRALNVASNLSKNVLRSAYGSYVESAFEALEGKERIAQNLIDEYTKDYGTSPIGDDLTKIKQTAQDASDTRFWANYIGLTLSNMPFTKAMFQPFDKALTVADNLKRLGLKVGKDGKLEEDLIKFTSDFWTKNAVTRAIKKPLEFLANKTRGAAIPFSEGGEELYQLAIDEGTQNYYTSSYNHDSNQTFLNSLVEGFKAVGSGVGNVMTEEGAKTALAGIVGGGFQELGANLLQRSMGSTPQQELDKPYASKWEKVGDDYIKKDQTYRQYLDEELQDISSQAGDLLKQVTDPATYKGTLQEQFKDYQKIFSSTTDMLDAKETNLNKEVKDVARFHSILPYVAKGYKDILMDKVTQQVLEDDTIAKEDKEKIKQDIIKDINLVDNYYKKMEQTFTNPFSQNSNPNEFALYEDLKRVGSYHLFMMEQQVQKRDSIQKLYGDRFVNNPVVKDILNHFFLSDKSTRDSEKANILKVYDKQIAQIDKDLALVTEGSAEIIDTKSLREKRAKLKEVRDKIGLTLNKNIKDATFKAKINDLLDNIYELETGAKLLNPNIEGFTNYDEIFSNLFYFDDLLGKIEDNLGVFKDLQSGKVDSIQDKIRWLSNYREKGQELAQIKSEIKSGIVEDEALTSAKEQIDNSNLSDEGKQVAKQEIIKQVSSPKEVVINTSTVQAVITKTAITDKVKKEEQKETKLQEKNGFAIFEKKSDDIIAGLLTKNSLQDKLNYLTEENILQPIIISKGKGVKTSQSTIDYYGRVIVLIRIGDVNIPFYISTGLAGKKLTQPGKWYATFGIGNDGWINKTRDAEIAVNYNHPLLQKTAKILDEGLGRVDSTSLNKLYDNDIEEFNKQLNFNTNPVTHSEPKALYKHVEKVFNQLEQEYNKYKNSLTPEPEDVLTYKELLADKLNSLGLSPTKSQVNALVNVEETVKVEDLQRVFNIPYERAIDLANNINGSTEIPNPPQQDYEDKLETIKAKQEEDNLLTNNIGKQVVYQNKVYTLTEEDDKSYLESETDIITLGDIEGKSLQDYELKIYTPLQKSYQITSIDNNSVVVNGVAYQLSIDANNKLVGLIPANNPLQLIKNKNLIHAIEIERNKIATQNLEINNEQEVLAEIRQYNEVVVIENLLNINYSQFLDDVLEKLYDEKALSSSEKLSVELWVNDALERVNKLVITHTQEEYYQNTLENLKTIQALLYQQPNEDINQTTGEGSTKTRTGQTTGEEVNQEEVDLYRDRTRDDADSFEADDFDYLNVNHDYLTKQIEAAQTIEDLDKLDLTDFKDLQELAHLKRDTLKKEKTPKKTYIPQKRTSGGVSLESKLLDSLWVFVKGDILENKPLSKATLTSISDSLKADKGVIAGEDINKFFSTLSWSIKTTDVKKSNILGADPGLRRITSSEIIEGKWGEDTLVTIQKHDGLVITEALVNEAIKFNPSLTGSVKENMLFKDFINLLTQEDYDYLNFNPALFSFKQTFTEAKNLLNNQDSLYDNFKLALENSQALDSTINNYIDRIELIQTGFINTSPKSFSDDIPFNFIKTSTGIINKPTIRVLNGGQLDETFSNQELVQTVKQSNVWKDGKLEDSVEPGLYTIFTYSSQGNNTVSNHVQLAKMNFQISLDVVKNFISDPFSNMKEFSSKFQITALTSKGNWKIEPKIKNNQVTFVFFSTTENARLTSKAPVSLEDFSELTTKGEFAQMLNLIKPPEVDNINIVSIIPPPGENQTYEENQIENATVTFGIARTFYRVQPKTPNISFISPPQDTESEVIEQDSTQDDEQLTELKTSLEDDKIKISDEEYSKLSGEEKQELFDYFGLTDILTKKPLTNAQVRKRLEKSKFVSIFVERGASFRESLTSEQKENLEYLLKNCIANG